MKLALCLIVKSDDNEANDLARCLGRTVSFVDKIFITITYKDGEKPNKKVEDIAKMFGAEISYFKWVNDFSKARNYNFSQVPKEYTHIFWLDSDDVVRGIEKLKDTIKENPQVDVFSMFYLYAFDEWKSPTIVHHKTRVVKNDGCVEWVGALHEDFKNNRNLTTYHIKGIEVLHLTNEKRISNAKERNLEVAKCQIKENPDDPRSFWNMGNSLKSLGNNDEAIKMLEKFIKLSNSDDEKYIAKLRIAECYWHKDEKNKAIDEARYAIGIKPEYPDAYHLLGSLYFEIEQFEKAKEMYLSGLIKKPPYYSIIVYNPRDYDYTPLMNLAKTYFRLSLPTLALECLDGCLKICPENEGLKKLIKPMKKEATKFEKVIKIIGRLKKIKDKDKLKKELDKVPKELKDHPGICNLRNINFVKKESSGKDLIIYCGLTSEEWTPETAKAKGIGGSEEAIIHLSQGLAKKGWNVTVYNNCGHKELKFGDVVYKPFWSWNYRDKQDVVILWRIPRLAYYEINSPKIYIDLHDTLQGGEFSEERLKNITKIFVKSKFHRSLYPDIPDDKFVIIPNGIDEKVFEQKLERNLNLLINTSSPDRGLSVLVDLFKEVKKQVPKAQLKWAYGWNVFDAVHIENTKVMEWKDNIIKKMKEAGVENLGRISHNEVAKLYLTANIFAYPSEFAEIDCISLSKAIAGGAIPVTTDFSAIGERVGQGGYYIHSEKTKDNWCEQNQFDFSIMNEKQKKKWVDIVVRLLKNPPPESERRSMREWARKTYSWENIVNQWDKELCQK